MLVVVLEDDGEVGGGGGSGIILGVFFEERNFKVFLGEFVLMMIKWVYW